MDLLAALVEATCDLLYPSETDAEVQARAYAWPFPWEGEGEPVECLGAEAFFRPLYETEDASRYHAIYGLMAGGLDDLAYYRVGRVRVGIFVVGTEPHTGRTVGIETVSVET